MRRRALGTMGLALSILVSIFFLDSFAGPIRKEQEKPRFQVPPGFIVEKVAGPPLVRYPLFAAFDDRGRLFRAEGPGTNLPADELLKLKKHLGPILLLQSP